MKHTNNIIKRLRSRGLKVRTMYLPSNKYGIKSPRSLKPSFLISHNTSNNASAEAEAGYMIRNNQTVSYHIVVDEKEAIFTIPLNRNAYHAGNTYANNNSIGLEIARSTSSKDLYLKAENNAAIVVAEVLREYNWGIDKVRKHKEFRNTNCPHRTDALGWNRYLNIIRDKLNNNKKEDPKMDYKKTNIKINANGQNHLVQGHKYKGHNYIKLRDAANIVGADVEFKGNNKSINIKPKKRDLVIDGENTGVSTLVLGNENYVRLRDLHGKLDLEVGYNKAKKKPTLNRRG